MNNIYMSLLLSLIAGLSTVIGSLLIFIKIKRIGEFITFSLSFSIGIMTLISIFDLIPSSVPIIINKYYYLYGIPICILTFLLGYLSISKINKKIDKSNNKSSLYKIGIVSMISLMLHNFPEGMAVFMGAYTNISIGIKLCIAIMLHNIPEGIAIAVPLYYSGVGKRKTFLYTLFSGLTEPLGALLTYLLFKNYINDIFLSFVLLFVAGLMISLSINDMLKEALSYNKTKYIYIGILSSCFVIVLALLI
mgnify:FL=1